MSLTFRFLTFAFSVALALGNSACSTVPAMDGPANVSLSAVASRIKCDLARIVANKIEQHSEFEFLLDWTAKAHLTLAVDNITGINPGATIINPLHNATPLGGAIGAVSQSFSVGLGAGLANEAVATTDIEFYLSFSDTVKELKAEPLLGGCLLPNGLLLDSDLQLDALFDRALEPVAQHILVKGNHPSFSTSPPAAPSKKVISEYKNTATNAAEMHTLTPTRLPFDKLTLEERGSLVDDKLTNVPLLQPGNPPAEGIKPLELSPEVARQFREIATKNARKTYDDNLLNDIKAAALQQERKAQGILKNIIEPGAELIVASFPACAISANQYKNEAAVQAIEISNSKVDADQAKDIPSARAALDKMTTKIKSLIATQKKLVLELDTACNHKKPPVPKVDQYDPIDLISQTINFYITPSGSIDPAWKLVRVTAPIAPALLTASRKYTNTLVVAFGRPDAGKAVSVAVSNQILTSTLRDALTNVH